MDRVRSTLSSAILRKCLAQHGSLNKLVTTVGLPAILLWPWLCYTIWSSGGTTMARSNNTPLFQITQASAVDTLDLVRLFGELHRYNATLDPRFELADNWEQL